MAFVVVFDPSRDLCKRCWPIRDRTDVEIVPFEGLHESLCSTIAFRAGHRREVGSHPQLAYKLPCELCPIRGTIVCQHFNTSRRLMGSKALFDGRDQHIADIATTDAGVEDRTM